MGAIRISVLISGGGTNLEALIRAIEEKHISARVVQVIADSSQAYGLIRAQKHQIPTRVLMAGRKAFSACLTRDQELLNYLQEAETDLVVLAGYLKKIPGEVLNAYPNRIMNIHPSLIPAFAGPGWYGMKVHEGVWQRGAKITGATVHFVNEEMDGGPIILQESVTLEEKDDPRSIQQKVLEIEHRILPEAVALFAAHRLKVKGQRVNIEKEVNET